MLIIRRSKLHYTAYGIITPLGVMIPILTSWWWADVLETCRDMKWNLLWNKLFASSWLNTEINILRCSTVSRTLKKKRLRLVPAGNRTKISIRQARNTVAIPSAHIANFGISIYFDALLEICLFGAYPTSSVVVPFPVRWIISVLHEGIFMYSLFVLQIYVSVPAQLSRLDGPGLESWWGGGKDVRTDTDRPWDPPSLL